MNELKPEDVMRALDKHADYENDNCFECPYKNHLSTEVGNCVDHLVRYALALLREKDAEIERLQAYNANLICANTDITNRHKDYVEEAERIARADAITEFAERAKRRLPIVSQSVFDKIAQEMKGETDELYF